MERDKTDRSEKERVNQRRILYLLHILYEQTDEAHPITTSDIMEQLAAYGVPASRKGIKADIALLQELGADILVVRSREMQHFMANRRFQMPELKLLVDAVAASKLVTERKSHELIEKLTLFASIHEAETLRRYVYTAGRVKPVNESVYYVMDMIHDAIHTKRKITFQYIDYTPEKKRVYKHDGKIYTFSPFALLWNEDHYYVIGHSENHGRMISFRVDRMANAALLDEPATSPPDGFDPASYARQVFDMFDGPEETVTLLCENSLMKVIVDRFGEDVDTAPYDAERFQARVRVAASPTFYGWVFQFGGRIRIVAPNTVENEYLRMCQAPIS